MKVKVILNPYANRWQAKKQQTAIVDAFRQAELAYDLALTEEPGQATRLARQAAEANYDAIISAGGDGTLNEVVNGLIAAAGSGPTRPLGVLPIGTGNDFNDMAGLPRRLQTAVNIFAAGQTRQIDAGRLTHDRQTHYFDNNSAVAMEPMVTLENVRMTRVSGNLRYILATIKALIKLKAWQMRIVWDDGSYEGPTYLLSVCNSPRTGGIFRMAPQAKMDDGLFDFVFAPAVPKSTVVMLVGRLLNGSHIHHPRIIYGKTSRLTIDSNPATPIHADGEIVTAEAQQIEYEILPGKITLLSP